MVSKLTSNALVGKFEFIKITRLEFLDWVRLKWNPLIKTVPRDLMIMNDWICFHFLLAEDRMKIEERFRVIEKGSLVLTRWHIGFNLWKERLLKNNLWVMFPLHCWFLVRFMVVENSLGRFILMEDDHILDFD